MFCYIKNEKFRGALDKIYDISTQIREFVTGFIIFEILTCAIYEVSISKALEKPFNFAACTSLMISYIVIFAYLIEIILMIHMASKYKLENNQVIFYSIY